MTIGDPADDDKAVLVLHLGDFEVQAGFAGEDVPRLSFANVVAKNGADSLVGSAALKSGLAIQWVQKRGIVEDWQAMDAVLEHVYTELDILGQEHAVLLSLSALTPREQRHRLVQTLFMTREVPSISCYPTEMLTYELNSNDVLTVHIDESYTTVFPVYDGIPLPEGIVRAEIGFRDAASYLTFLSQESVTSLEIAHQALLQHGRISGDDITALSAIAPTPRVVELLDGSSEEVLLSNSSLEQACALVFHPGLAEIQVPGLAELVLESLSKCPVLSQTDLAQKIYVMGSPSRIPGFVDRLDMELKETSWLPRHCVRATPDGQWSTWVGGSILASLAAFTKLLWIPREEFMQGDANASTALQRMIWANVDSRYTPPYKPGLRDVLTNTRALMDLRNPLLFDSIFRQLDEDMLIPDMETLLDWIFTDELNIDPTEHNMVVLHQAPLTNRMDAVVTRILLEHFQAASVTLVSMPEMVALEKGRTNAVVIDLGHSSLRVTPVVNGHIIPEGFRIITWGGHQANEDLQDFLADSDDQAFLDAASDWVLVQEIKEHLCFVESVETADDDKTANFTLPNGRFVRLEGDERTSVFEPLFMSRSMGGVGLAECIHECILLCEEDTHSSLAANIQVVGGGAKIRGLGSRLYTELATLARENDLDLDYHVHCDPAKARNAAWAGALKWINKDCDREFSSLHLSQEDLGVSALRDRKVQAYEPQPNTLLLDLGAYEIKAGSAEKRKPETQIPSLIGSLLYDLRITEQDLNEQAIRHAQASRRRSFWTGAKMNAQGAYQRLSVGPRISMSKTLSIASRLSMRRAPSSESHSTAPRLRLSMRRVPSSESGNSSEQYYR